MTTTPAPKFVARFFVTIPPNMAEGTPARHVKSDPIYTREALDGAEAVLLDLGWDHLIVKAYGVDSFDAQFAAYCAEQDADRQGLGVQIVGKS